MTAISCEDCEALADLPRCGGEAIRRRRSRAEQPASLPMTTFTPSTSADVLAAVQWALSENAPLEILGHGTKRGIGRPLQAAHTLDLSQLSGVTLYEPEELVLTAKAGTPLAEIETMLAERNQQLAFEPMDYGPLLGPGAAAARRHDRRRARRQSVRPAPPEGGRGARPHPRHQAVSGRGEAFKSGGRVVKNVTGYDLSKLMAGSWGTLAVVTDVTFKVLPAAETETTLAHARPRRRGCGRRRWRSPWARAPRCRARRTCRKASPTRVAGGALGAEPATLLRVEGFGPSVAYRIAHLKDLLKEAGIDEIDADRSRAVWRDVRDCIAFADGSEKPVWRVSMPPSEATGWSMRCAWRRPSRPSTTGRAG